MIQTFFNILCICLPWQIGGQKTYRCFYIHNAGTELTLTGLTITNGKTSIYSDAYSSSQGGAIYAGSSITLSIFNCIISSSMAITGSCNADTSYGGGLFMGSNGNFHLQSSSISSNRAYQGSGVYLSSATEALIEDCTFGSNTYYNYRTSCSTSYYQSYGD